MDTRQLRAITAAQEPVYATATRAFNVAGIWRRTVESIREALVKNGYPYQTRFGLFETAQSVYARPRVTLQTVNAQLSNTGTVNLIQTSRR